MEEQQIPPHEFIFAKPEAGRNSRELYDLYREHPDRLKDVELQVLPKKKQLQKAIMPYALASVVGTLVFFVLLWLTEDAKVNVSEAVTNAFAMGIIAWWAGILWVAFKAVKGYFAFSKKKKTVTQYFADFGRMAGKYPDWKGFGRKWFEEKEPHYFNSWKKYWINKRQWVGSEEKDENGSLIASGNYLFGKKEGMWEVYKPNGMYLREEFYEQGKMIWTNQK